MTSQHQIEILPVIDPNDRPDPDPATTASPEANRLQLLNHVHLYKWHVGEEAPEEVGPLDSPP